MTREEWELYEQAIRDAITETPYLKFTLSTWVGMVQFIEAQQSIGVEINREWLHKELQKFNVTIPNMPKRRKRRAIPTPAQ
jgi:hypothetical protein